MIFEPKIFYKTYLKDFHKTKAIYLKKMIENIEKYESDFFEEELNKKERENYIFTLKCDLRQTYFHSIETFFELFFALNPLGKLEYDDEYVLYKLTNSNWKETFKEIEKIANEDNTLEFLNNEISFQNFKITIGQYLFYFGLFDKEKYPAELFEDIENSIEAIKYGIKIIASDFIKREEYNAYKHGLRIIPAFSKLMLADAKNLEVKAEWDLSNSLSFYLKTQSDDKLTVVTKLLDAERDYQMTLLCSNLIHHLIYFRKFAFKVYDEEFDSKVKITLFGKDPIDHCNKINVNVQDIVYTIERIKGSR